ncbi:protocadherin Fat 4-like, partial [Scleropages formosus]
KLYRASVPENSSKGTLVTKVSATDADKGTNGEVRYNFRKTGDTISGVFEINETSGEIFVSGTIDFERVKKIELSIEARDPGGFIDSCAVVIEVVDVNDNIPVITLTSFTNPIPEDASPGTTIAIINVKDIDSGQNVKIYRWRKSRIYYQSSLPVIPYYPPHYADAGGTGTLQHVYNYEVCMTTDSRKSDCKIVRPCSQSVLVMDPSLNEKHGQNERHVLNNAEVSEQ